MRNQSGGWISKSNETEAKRVGQEKLEKVPSQGTTGATQTTALTSPPGAIHKICYERTCHENMELLFERYAEFDNWGVWVSSIIPHQPKNSNTWPWAWISLLYNINVNHSKHPACVFSNKPARMPNPTSPKRGQIRSYLQIV